MSDILAHILHLNTQWTCFLYNQCVFLLYHFYFLTESSRIWRKRGNKHLGSTHSIKQKWAILSVLYWPPPLVFLFLKSFPFSKALTFTSASLFRGDINSEGGIHPKQLLQLSFQRSTPECPHSPSLLPSCSEEEVSPAFLKANLCLCAWSCRNKDHQVRKKRPLIQGVL